MPKTKMDYSNTIIYKIFCKDPSIKEIYIGHTTNFVTRKSAHKTSCKNNNSYIYIYIRAHGGWDNWKIIILDDINCKNYEEARKAEQSYIDKYNSDLNSLNAYCVKDKEEKIEKEYNEKENTYKEYTCECCNYKCSSKCNLNKHLATLKHKKTENILLSAEIMLNSAKKVSKEFVCECGKYYKHKRSLTHHKAICNHTEPVCVEIQKTTPVSDEYVTQLIKDNADMKQNNADMQKLILSVVQENQKLTNKVIDMVPLVGNTITNNTNQFNINMFLNEECKNAINMSDFIKSIQVSMDQLHYTTNNGLGNGITKIIMDNMNKLSKYERPLHCSDLKRETIYIKDDDKWEKDTHKDKLKKAINKTSNKNYTALCDWTSENPDFMKYDDKQHFYAKTASTIGKPISDVEDKIIKSICKDNFIKE
jgi:hypothetical protein